MVHARVRSIGILAVTATILTVGGCRPDSDADKGAPGPSDSQSAKTDSRSGPEPPAGQVTPSTPPANGVTDSAPPEILKPITPTGSNPPVVLETTPDKVSMDALKALYGFDTTVDQHPVDSAVRAENGGLLVVDGFAEWLRTHQVDLVPENTWR